MKTALVFAVILGSALAAPAEDSQLEVQREKKAAYGQASSSYGQATPSYGQAAPSYGQAAPSYGQAAPSYGQAASTHGAPCGGGAALTPIALYLSPQSSGLALNSHYRADEHSEDKEEARSYYDSPAAGAGALVSPGSSQAYGKGLASGIAGLGSGIAGLGSGLGSGAATQSSAPSGPAVGLFPNAKVGACAVPLLLSCSPSVTSGHLASSGAAAYGPAAATYRAPTVEEHHKERETPERDNLELQSEHQEPSFETPKSSQNKFSSA